MKKKIIRPEGPAKKNNLAPILSEKNILARTKNPSPPPPEYQMDRALTCTCSWHKVAYRPVGMTLVYSACTNMLSIKLSGRSRTLPQWFAGHIDELTHHLYMCTKYKVYKAKKKICCISAFATDPVFVSSAKHSGT